jgi:hypothetical protein
LLTNYRAKETADPKIANFGDLAISVQVLLWRYKNACQLFHNLSRVSWNKKAAATMIAAAASE